MTGWQFCIFAGLLFLLLELFFPFQFFLAMAIGSFITSIFSGIIDSVSILMLIFAVSSVLSLLIFRPFLAKDKQEDEKSKETGISGQYIGKRAKVIKDVTNSDGAISIYGERWDARAIEQNSVFSEGCEVEIVRNDQLTMYVKEIKE